MYCIMYMVMFEGYSLRAFPIWEKKKEEAENMY